MLFDNTNGKNINNVNRRYIIKNVKPLKSYINYSEKTFLKNDRKLVYFNMSLKSFNDELHYAVRAGDKKIGKEYFDPNFTSQVFVGTIDKKLKNHREINVSFEDIKNGRLGLEDPRIFEWKNELHFSGDIPFNLIHKKQKNVFVNIDNGNHVVFEDHRGRQLSKNWMPYVEKDRLSFVTDVFPTTLLDAKTKKVKEFNNVDTKVLVSGGGRIFEINGYKTSIVHGKIPGMYWHSIAQWDKNWNLKISDPFYFNKMATEFSVGYEVHKNKVYFTYSEEDDGVVLCNLKLEDFLKSSIWSNDV
jgi:hypothetical protein